MEEILTSILIEAGEIIINNRMKYGKVENKESNEIVTSADIIANEFITQNLNKTFTNIPIYSEEGSDNESTQSTRWIIDPIDGTTPWVFGNSGFSISIALEENEHIVLGAVYDPVMKELFFAEKGKGAKRNNIPIEVDNKTPRDQSFMVVDWGNKAEKREEGLEYFKHFFLPEMFARRIVPQWAPALGLCHLAEGRIHALICNDTWVEDHSAASLIVQESNGHTSNFYNSIEFNHKEAGIIATSNLDLHVEIIKFLKHIGININ